MTEIAEAARVQIFLADYAIADASNKINALGVGYQIAVAGPNGFVAPCAVVILSEFPSKFAGRGVAIEFALYNDADQLVQAPGLMGDESPVRFAQHVVLERPVTSHAGLPVPSESLWCRHQLVANFQGGLPLPAGSAYEWRVAIDTLTRPDWACAFYVPAPPSGLVIG